MDIKLPVAITDDKTVLSLSILHKLRYKTLLHQLVVICEQQPKAILTSRVQGLSHLVHVPLQFLVPYVGMHYRHP